MGWMQYKQSDCLGQCTHSDIISTRHGAVIQAVAERGGFFRDQGYQLRNWGGFSAVAELGSLISVHRSWNGVGFSATRGISCGTGWVFPRPGYIAVAERAGVFRDQGATHVRGPRGHRICDCGPARATIVGSSSQADHLQRNAAMDESIGGCDAPSEEIFCPIPLPQQRNGFQKHGDTLSCGSYGATYRKSFGRRF